MNRDPHLIAVMGPPGAGKSTFINTASGSSFVIGKGLESCTTTVKSTDEFKVGGERVILLDTPGFDDTNIRDIDILEEIANYINKIYKAKKVLSGILYLHPITDRKIRGTTVRNIRVFESLVGKDTRKFVFVVTTLWDLLPDEGTGVMRETELKTNDKFFKGLIDGGAIFIRHRNTEETAHEIIQQVLDKRSEFPRQPPTTFSKNRNSKSLVSNSKDAVAIQSEMVDNNRRLGQTSAAHGLMGEYDNVIGYLKRKILTEAILLKDTELADYQERVAAIRNMDDKIGELEKRMQMVLKGGSPSFARLVPNALWK